MYQVGNSDRPHTCALIHLIGMSPEKFEPRVANVDLLSVVVNAEMKVDHTRRILMTLKRRNKHIIMHCLCPLIPNMVAMYSLVYYFDQSSIKF